MRIVWPLIVLLSAARAAGQPLPSVQGTVAGDLNVPVAGARVVLRYPTSPAALEVKEPGAYAVEASAPGFNEALAGATPCAASTSGSPVPRA